VLKCFLLRTNQSDPTDVQKFGKCEVGAHASLKYYKSWRHLVTRALVIVIECVSERASEEPKAER
jgi:hypothetical protein